MTPAELAARLHGREYRSEIKPEEERQAKDAGLVVVFGASDDLMEFRGAIKDEVGCYDGGSALLTKHGLLQNECEDEDCPYFASHAQEVGVEIEAVWGRRGEPTWTYKTTIPHATFDVMEDGGVYCRGIVFALDEARK